MRSGPALAASLLAALALAGCTGSLVLARVPDALLQGANGNGWASDGAHSQSQPVVDDFGLVQRQTLAYLDDGKSGDGGYPASLVVTTLKLFPTPSEAQLRDLLRGLVQNNSAQSGIQLGSEATEGSRTLHDGHKALFFVFTGTVTGTGALFTTTDATAKILGEVWNCPERGTSVASVGLAQVSSVQRLGDVPLSTNTNTGNWREIAADPDGSVDGQRGGDGLDWNVVCLG